MRLRFPRSVTVSPGESVPLQQVRGLRALLMKRSMHKHERQTEAAFRNPPFPLYGLPVDWKGFRFLGGRGWSSEMGTTSLTLGHASGAGTNATELRVLIGRDLHSLEMIKADVELYLELRDGYDEGPLRDRGDWRPAGIPIAGDRVDFEMVSGDEDRWGAVAVRDGLIISIEATGFPLEELSLVEITDVEPYVAGSHEYLRARFPREPN